jgi:hypothetical protein
MGGYCCIENLRSKTVSERNVIILSSRHKIKKEVFEEESQFIKEKKIENKEKEIEIELLNNLDSYKEKEEEKEEVDEDIFEIIPENMSSSKDLDSGFSSSEINDYDFTDNLILNKKNSTINSNQGNPFEVYNKMNKSSSFSRRIYLEIFSLSELEVGNRILNEINDARLNPLLYLKKIEYYSKFICQDSLTEQSHIYIDNQNNQRFKVFLKNGKQSFFECINFLTKLSEKMNNENFKLEKLTLMNDLKFPFPKNNLNLIDNDNYN